MEECKESVSEYRDRVQAGAVVTIAAGCIRKEDFGRKKKSKKKRSKNLDGRSRRKLAEGFGGRVNKDEGLGHRIFLMAHMFWA